jgi:NAD+ synthase
MLSLESLRINPKEVERRIIGFISDEVKRAGLRGGVVAVSGGVDSSTTLVLAVRSLGSENVRAVTMPERGVTSERDVRDVMELTKRVGVTCDVVEITSLLDVMRKALPLYDPKNIIAFGNVKARLRMAIVYHFANSLDMMVIGSANKTEWLLGYFTKYGDGGVDLMPIADLYKTQVRQLARHLEIPERIVMKTPTAGLWPGQTDEGELGVKYELLDLILYGWERGLKVKEISEELGLPLSTVEGVLRRVERNEHKRRLPLILRLS